MANIAAGVLEVPSTLFANQISEVKGEDKLRRVLIAPFGDWPNSQGLQRLKKEDAENIVNEFRKPSNVLKRSLGLSWFIGHPDHPNFANRYQDTKSYGRIKDLEVGDDGLYASVKFSSEGEKLIADEAFSGHSVNWFLREDKTQKGVWRPFRLKSVGFTNEPNLPVPPVTSANEEQAPAERWQLMANLRLFANTNYHESDAIDASRKAFKASAKAAETGDEVDHHSAVTAHLEAKKANEKSSAAKGGCGIRDAAADQHTKMADHHMKAAKASKKAAEGSAEEEAKETPAEEAKEKQAGNEDISEGAADAPMKNRLSRMANMRKIRSMVDEKEGVFKGGVKEFTNSFGPWEDFDACVVHMTGKGGYSADVANKVCGKLKAELE